MIAVPEGVTQVYVVEDDGDGTIRRRWVELTEEYDESFSGYLLNIEGKNVQIYGIILKLDVSIDARANPLTSLDVSKNTALTELYCQANRLTSLDLSKNTALTMLYCNSNQLTSLDVSKNTALTMLYCNSNQLTSLDLSKNIALTELYCNSNQLTSLDVSKNTALTMLECYSNKLTSFDVSKNTALTMLYCNSNTTITRLRTATKFGSQRVAPSIVSLITNATSTSGTLEYVSGGQYETQIVNAAKTKGWTTKAIA